MAIANVLRSNYCAVCFRPFGPSIGRGLGLRPFVRTIESQANHNDIKQQSTTGIRRNELGIQMINEAVRAKLFGNVHEGLPSMSNVKPRNYFKNADDRSQDDYIASKSYTTPSSTNLCQVKSHLSKHGFWNERHDEPAFEVQYSPEVLLEIPQLQGNNVDEHFKALGDKYSTNYKKLLDDLANSELPQMPKEWIYRSGWTMYHISKAGDVLETSQVDYPPDDCLVFDVEVCMRDGDYPTMATAVSKKAWYSWCSPHLIAEIGPTKDAARAKLGLDDLIRFGPSNSERLIIGHNVSFDRSFVREQYTRMPDQMRFFDTMSLHICISGLTGYQRALSSSYNSAKRKGINEGDINKVFEMKNQPNPINWIDFGSANSLAEVYNFYCGNKSSVPLKKELRDVFVKGSLDDVRADFQNLMTYCAKDVQATADVFGKQWTPFLERFPHPVTLAGMLEMSIMCLPCDEKTWYRYIDEAESVYEDLERELTMSLIAEANKACALLNEDKFKDDPWLWDLDWSTQDLRFRKNSKNDEIAVLIPGDKRPRKKKIIKAEVPDSVTDVLKTEKAFNKVQPLLPGYPSWYRDFCSQPLGASRSKASDDVDKDWEPGPFMISTQMRSVPKLLRMMWNGYALHHDLIHGWGYLVPVVLDNSSSQTEGDESYFPYDSYIKIAKPVKFKALPDQDNAPVEFDDGVIMFETNAVSPVDLATGLPEKQQSEDENGLEGTYCPDVRVKGSRFYTLPHKNGPTNRVGNPLGKDFLRYVEEGRLTSYGSDISNRVLSLSKALSYWKMNSKRINSQIVINVNDGTTEAAILPRVVAAGTVTRRAVEPTWLTASNAYKDRVGSELKAMISAPKGYKFVGADVDSQELWIASLLADANFAKVHGCTGIGWMTLQGTKSNGTDMHSKTASLVNIDRNQAKVLNYGRIYGAGKAFAARFLKQNDPSLSEIDAKKKAHDIYKQTKGIKKYGEWTGGTESHMFNKLEEIARSCHPETPVLSCRISRALEAEAVRDDFVTSLVNWVVQSSAVDYLHLMLVSMRWLMDEYNIDGRFAISIHDEVRYLVKDEHVNQAALALQITNLLTRGLFSYKLGLKDLPQSVAFFSSIDIDTVLRKEIDMDCKTPSNPYGLKMGYGVPVGESLNIYEVLNRLQTANRVSFKQTEEI